MTAHDATPTPSGAPARVLVVVSAANRIPLRDGGDEPTGTYLGELVHPTDAMLDAGFQLSFATPGGRAPTIDGTSCSLMYFGLSRVKRDEAFASYARLLDLGLGSPRPLAEVAADADFGAVLRSFHDRRRTTGLICHAPAALAAAPEEDGRWIYDGYRMTVFKTVVDTALSSIPVARRFHGRLPEDPARLLGSRGARIEQTRLPMGSKVVEDRELITGQDPYSALAFGTAFVDKVRRASRAPVT
jgi:putative intracellular protease/amidase